MLTALADGVRGQGQRIGQATTDLNQVLKALNDRSDTIREDWRSFKSFNDTYARCGTRHRDHPQCRQHHQHDRSPIGPQALDSLLLNTIGFSNCGTRTARAPARTTWSRAVNVLEPTTNLLMKYNPDYTCWLQGANWTLDHRRRLRHLGRQGRQVGCNFDVALLLGNDPYQYPDNLPIVAAKGGPGGKPGCGSLPDRHQELPGAPSGHQHRLGHRPGHPAQPRPRASVLGRLVPGHPRGAAAAEHPPVPARTGARSGHGPGHAAYGAALVRPGGVPLWPGVPPAPDPRAAPPSAGHRPPTP